MRTWVIAGLVFAVTGAFAPASTAWAATDRESRFDFAYQFGEYCG